MIYLTFTIIVIIGILLVGSPFPWSLFSINFSESFFATQGFWTFITVVVALSVPWIVDFLNNRSKKSKLLFTGVSIVDQNNNNSYDSDNPSNQGPFNIGRIIIKNTGKYKAQSVEAYIEKIIFDKEVRNDFFPVPLSWTHGHLNKNGVTVRDIYPNQTVYLDIFKHVFDSNVVGDNSVVFAVAAGQDIDNLSRMNLGESELLIKLYQESGQVDKLYLKTVWNGISVSGFSILDK